MAMMFLKSSTGNYLNDHIISLSPLIHYHSKTPENVIPYACFKARKNGNLYNQPIEYKVERNNDLLFQQGDKWYQETMDRWVSWEG